MKSCYCCWFLTAGIKRSRARTHTQHTWQRIHYYVYMNCFAFTCNIRNTDTDTHVCIIPRPTWHCGNKTKKAGLNGGHRCVQVPLHGGPRVQYPPGLVYVGVNDKLQLCKLRNIILICCTCLCDRWQQCPYCSLLLILYKRNWLLCFCKSFNVLVCMCLFELEMNAGK